MTQQGREEHNADPAGKTFILLKKQFCGISLRKTENVKIVSVSYFNQN